MFVKPEPTTSPPSTSSAAVSPARTSASQARAPDWPARGPGSGESSPDSFAFFDPSASSWRTSQLSLLGDSPTCSPTLPRSGSMRSGRLYERPTLERPTGGKGSSWSRGEYPTPSATDYGSSNNGTRDGSTAYDTAGNPSLSSWARTLWPTATAGDAKASGAAGYSTASGRHAGTTLTDAAVRNWATPTARDGKGPSGNARCLPREAQSGRLRPTTCTHGGECRWTLNPRFVEWLMGLPRGWLTGADS